MTNPSEDLVPEDLSPEVIPALEKLEAAFRPLEHDLPPEALLWTSPEGAGPEDDA